MILTKSGLPLLTAARDFVYIYASFKSNLKCFKNVLMQLRMGVLPLNANRFRYAHKNTSKILCSVCENEIEDKV